MDDEFISNLCGNHSIYQEIINWLRTFYDAPARISEKSCVFLSGNPCTGKTYSMAKICEYLDLYVVNIDSNTCHNASQLKDIIYKSTTSSLVQSITNTSNKKSLLLTILIPCT